MTFSQLVTVSWFKKSVGLTTIPSPACGAHAHARAVLVIGALALRTFGVDLLQPLQYGLDDIAARLDEWGFAQVPEHAACPFGWLAALKTRGLLPQQEDLPEVEGRED